MDDKEKEIWLFSSEILKYGLSYMIISIVVLGLSINEYKVYAYSVVFLYTGIMIYSIIFEDKKIKQALNWDRVKGMIIESEKVSRICIGSKRGRINSIDMKYTYIINNEKIYNYSWSFFKCENALYSSKDIDEILKTMRPRSEVDVFVNPKNRYEAYINKDELLREEPLSHKIFLTLLVVGASLWFIVYFA
jgi:hypothetical protein